MHVAEHHSLLELQRLVRRQTDARLLLRLQMVLLARQGRTAPQIAEILAVSRRGVQIWVARYNAHGLEGLAERTHRRQPPATDLRSGTADPDLPGSAGRRSPRRRAPGRPYLSHLGSTKERDVLVRRSSGTRQTQCAEEGKRSVNRVLF